MKFSFAYRTKAVAVAIGIIAASTAILSWNSYRYLIERENLTETAFVQSNIKLAAKYIERIEQTIIDNDRILSEMIDVDAAESKWPAMVDAIKKNADLNVDQVYFLSSDSRTDQFSPLFPPYSFGISNLWSAFRASFILNELNIERLALNQVHHLHKERPDNYFFASYVLKQTAKGKMVLICYQMNFDKIVALLDRNLRDLQTDYYVSIVDFENNGIYNAPISRSSKYYYETRFPTTLYKWILQMVPRKYTEIEKQKENERLLNLGFLGLNASLVFLGLTIIYIASRRERQLRQLKEDFIGNVSHELKTPLSLIRMFSEILVTGRARNEEIKREYYNIIYSQSDRMSRLISNLLDFASLEHAGSNKNFEYTNIAGLIGKELEAYRQEIQKDGFQLAVEIDSQVPQTLVNSNAITMALFNLLDNSVKYSGGQKEIAVHIVQSNGFIELSVTDRGIGIPREERQKIFDKFYRGSDPAVRGVRGSGIGLSITKHVAELHGGEVLVESEPGKGSTFTLRIPIRRPPNLEGEEPVH
jgi:two-component system, OmpR family, phosphate regulon sensor histidine kinase PhoR